MNLLVTGGAGFIGSNFIRQRLLEKGSPLTRIVNLDALTYAGNPANLADVAHDPRYVFVHGDIGDTALVASCSANIRSTRSSTSPPSRMSTDPSIHPSRSSRPTSSERSAC